MEHLVIVSGQMRPSKQPNGMRIKQSPFPLWLIISADINVNYGLVHRDFIYSAIYGVVTCMHDYDVL